MTERDFFKNEVLRLLNVRLQPFGFKLVKSASEFVKKTDLGWNKYQIVFLLKDNGWEIKPSLLVRFNIVENLFHQISDFDEKYQKGTPTIGTAIEDLDVSGLDARFILDKESKIDSIVEGLFELFKTIALPFFERFNSLEALDKSLNNNPEDTSLTGSIFKGTKSLIIANLIKRNDFDNLKDIYQKYYESYADGFYLPEYLRLKALLTNT